MPSGTRLCRHAVECVSNGRSRLRQWTLIITTEQDYNKARGSHVTKRGYTEVLAKPTKYSISPITSNNHCMTLVQGFSSLCHTRENVKPNVITEHSDARVPAFLIEHSCIA